MQNDRIHKNIMEFKSQMQKWNEEETSDVYLKMYYGEENLKFQNHDNMDIRLFQPEYMKNAVTLQLFAKKENVMIGYTTLYIVGKDVYGKEFVWRRDSSGRMLKKMYLEEWESLLGEHLLITAFSNTRLEGKHYQSNYHKWVKGKTYLRILDVLARDIPILEEPTGTYACTIQQLKKNELSEDDIGDFSNLGKVRDSSRASLQFAELAKLQRVPDVYHNITLGPIYYGYLFGRRRLK